MIYFLLPISPGPGALATLMVMVAISPTSNFSVHFSGLDKTVRDALSNFAIATDELVVGVVYKD